MEVRARSEGELLYRSTEFGTDEQFPIKLGKIGDRFFDGAICVGLTEVFNL